VRSNPQSTIQVKEKQIKVTAEVAGPEKRSELWARLVELAPNFAGYEKRTSREIPMVILQPVDEQFPLLPHWRLSSVYLAVVFMPRSG
jgi:hypothetical protein